VRSSRPGDIPAGTGAPHFHFDIVLFNGVM
jgi:hypothetical protein